MQLIILGGRAFEHTADVDGSKGFRRITRKNVGPDLFEWRCHHLIHFAAVVRGFLLESSTREPLRKVFDWYRKSGS